MPSRSQKIPREFRCLKALYPTAIALLILIMWNIVGSAICRLTLTDSSQCQASMPSLLIWMLLLVVSGGLMHFIYRVYRDFYRGDLWIDRW